VVRIVDGWAHPRACSVDRIRWSVLGLDPAERPPGLIEICDTTDHRCRPQDPGMPTFGQITLRTTNTREPFTHCPPRPRRTPSATPERPGLLCAALGAGRRSSPWSGASPRPRTGVFKQCTGRNPDPATDCDGFRLCRLAYQTMAWVWRAHADSGPQHAADQAGAHGGFDRVSVDAPWAEVDTTDGYSPGLEEIVAFVNGPGPDGLEPSTSSLSGCLGGLRDWGDCRSAPDRRVRG
jgi:hypothetical protein